MESESRTFIVVSSVMHRLDKLFETSILRRFCCNLFGASGCSDLISPSLSIKS